MTSASSTSTPSGHDPARGRWDAQAIRAGAGVCLVFAIPLQVAALLVGKTSDLGLLLRVGALFGFLLGAGVSAWAQQRELPLAHGLVTAIGAFAAVQVLFILGRALVGNDLRLWAAIGNLAPVVGVGLFGGFLGQALRRSGFLPTTQRVRTDRLADTGDQGDNLS
jgi:hypothetical protein